jgi:hypothetical protein
LPASRIPFRIAAIVVAAVVIEASAAAVTFLLVRRGWMVEIRPASAERAAAFVAHRDPLLGWGRSFAASPQPACVSTYGDSFTAGSGVSERESYPQQLAARLGCRVANFGVGGYGDDQSLMLARAQRTLDRAPIVVIGHTAEDLMRNVSRYEGFLYPGSDDAEPAFKPRFLRTTDGRLATLAAPVTDERLLRQFERHPDMVAIDAFADRPRRRFPFSLAVASWFVNDFHVRAALARVPRYAPFHDPAHPSDAFELTKAILVAFAREAERDGKQAIVLLIPEAQDFEHHRKTGAWIDRPLENAIAQSGVRVVHAGQVLGFSTRAELCTVYINCDGHFTPAGNALLAHAVADTLEPLIRERSSIEPARPTRRPSS